MICLSHSGKDLAPKDCRSCLRVPKHKSTQARPPVMRSRRHLVCDLKATMFTARVCTRTQVQPNSKRTGLVSTT